MKYRISIVVAFALLGILSLLATQSPVVHDREYAHSVARYMEEPSPENHVAYLEHAVRVLRDEHSLHAVLFLLAGFFVGVSCTVAALGAWHGIAFSKA